MFCPWPVIESRSNGLSARIALVNAVLAAKNPNGGAVSDAVVAEWTGISIATLRNTLNRL
jgi:hypothetical protein